MNQMHINWFDLESAFEWIPDDYRGDYGVSNYFDKQSGCVVLAHPDVELLECTVMQELEEAVEGVEWTVEDVQRLPSFKVLSEDEQASVLLHISLQWGGLDDRFVSVPTFESSEVFEWMEAFVSTVADEATQQRLAAALEKRKPFRHFRDALESDQRLQREWRSFEAACQRKVMIQWLHSIDVEPLNPEELTYDPDPMPETGLRNTMFAEVRRFVRFARDLPGVQRIALLGSLTTDKQFPKDVDLLVTVADDSDLKKLAALGRQIAGHMTSHSAGADVFLANPAGEYIGRTCPWKRCGAGIRTSCDARSCGRRRYLHDDLDAIELRQSQIENPPVTLWPKPTATSDVPSDVQEHLIELLELDQER